METKALNKKKATLKVDKATSVRQLKKESVQRNMTAIVDAVTKYNTKPV